MAGVRRYRSDRPLESVEANVVGALVLPPEALVELVIEADRPLSQLLGPLGVAPDRKGFRHSKECVEGIALKLAQRDRQLRDGAVLVLDGVVRILPTLVVEADR